MSGPLFIGQQIQEALDTNNMTLASSDGNEGSLASNNLIAQLQDQGLEVTANTPDTTCAAFNAQVCDIQQQATLNTPPPTEPRPDLKTSMDFG